MTDIHLRATVKTLKCCSSQNPVKEARRYGNMFILPLCKASCRVNRDLPATDHGQEPGVSQRRDSGSSEAAARAWGAGSGQVATAQRPWAGSPEALLRPACLRPRKPPAGSLDRETRSGSQGSS